MSFFEGLISTPRAHVEAFKREKVAVVRNNSRKPVYDIIKTNEGVLDKKFQHVKLQLNQTFISS